LPTRHRARWTNSELNALHSEYENKQLTVQEIAALHNRTVRGVLNKLASEGLIDFSWKDARGWVSAPVLSLKPPIEFDEGEEEDTDVSVVSDDPNDEDYVPEESEDGDDHDDTEEEEPVDVKQQFQYLQGQISSIFKFLQDNFPKKRVVSQSI